MGRHQSVAVIAQQVERRIRIPQTGVRFSVAAPRIVDGEENSRDLDAGPSAEREL